MGAWQAALARQAGGGREAVLAVVGDSWVNIPWALSWPLADRLRGAVGPVEGGYASASSAHWTVGAEPAVRHGSWRDVRILDADALGPEGSHALSAAAGARIVFPGAARGLTLLYARSPGGGTFRWRADGRAWRTVPTAGPASVGHVHADAVASYVEVEVVQPSTGGVRIVGAVAERDAAVRLLKFGHDGALAGQYAALAPGPWAAAVGEDAPDAVAVLLGTNDMTAGVAPPAYRTHLAEIVRRVRALPSAPSCVVVAPGPNDLRGTPHAMPTYVAEARAVAAAEGCGFADLHAAMGGSFAAAAAQGWMADDGIHPSEAGGAVIADALMGLLTPPAALPAPWTSADVGAPSVAGTATYADGAFAVTGGGELWNAADAFHFVSRPLAADGALTARVGSLVAARDWARAALMVRASDDPAAPYAAVAVSRLGVHVQYRTTAGATTLGPDDLLGVGAPLWIRLERSGTSVTASWSASGTDWSVLGTVGLPALAGALRAGLAVSANDYGEGLSASAVFTDVSLVAGTTGADGPPALAAVGPAFPNPAAGRVAVRLAEAATVDVIDALGRVVAPPRASPAGEATADVSALPAGAYAVRVTGAGGTAVRRFVVVR